MKKIGLVLLSLIMLVGCSSKPTEATSTLDTKPTDTPSNTQSTTSAMICGQQSDEKYEQNTFIVENGEVARLEQVITYTITENNNAESIQSTIQEQQEKMAKEEGVNYVIEENDNEVTATITYDLNTISEAILKELGLGEDQRTDGKLDLSKIRNKMIEGKSACQEF